LVVVVVEEAKKVQRSMPVVGGLRMPAAAVTKTQRVQTVRHRAVLVHVLLR
jgi:hypothetical protein